MNASVPPARRVPGARFRLRFTAAVLGCAGFCSVGLAAPAQADSAAAEEPLDYVALGDSYAAAPIVPENDWSQPACLNSKSGYPEVAADATGAQLTDVSCSGAKVSDFAGRQFGIMPPQYDALGKKTDVVSLTIGGNDTNLVAATLSCLNVLPEPSGFSCADRYTAGGRDKLAEDIDAWKPVLGKALATIRDRAPNARVYVVGYGDYIRKGGCFPTQPIWGKDADYIQGTVNKLSAALREGSAAHGATYVDGFAATAGHDSCAPPAERYTEGLIPTHPASPLHPNAAGSAALGKALARSISAG